MPGVEPAAVLDVLRDLRQPSVTAGGANIVVGFRPSLWQQWESGNPPIDDFELPALDGLARTPHDVWVWTHGTGEDVMLDIGRAVAAVLAPVATLQTDLAGFVYHDGRDLTGDEAAHGLHHLLADLGIGSSGHGAHATRWRTGRLGREPRASMRPVPYEPG